MLHFECDYNNGCHPQILEYLVKNNSEYESGYGEDKFSKLAKERIKKTFDCQSGDVALLTGGTQTNFLIISSMLKNYEGVISADTGHVNVHEAGAIEKTGHKVLAIKQKDGKICASDLKAYLETFYADGNCHQMVYPGMVYISFPTELGTIYSKKELKSIYSICKSYKISLFIDGARLGYGLAAEENDISYEELHNLCDVFYIGGTKVGALCGEAVVFKKGMMPEHFITTTKQHGALVAKGRLTGSQFAVLFNKNLYKTISEHAIDMAGKLKDLLKKKGYRFYLETPTNQQFVIVPNTELKKIAKSIVYGFWDKFDNNNTVIRFCTSWSTTDKDLEALEEKLPSIKY